MAESPFDIKKFAEAHRIPVSEAERALGVAYRSDELKKAYQQYELSNGLSDHGERAEELRRWIKIELKKAKKPEDYRLIHSMTPSTFPEIVHINSVWDQVSRRELRKNRDNRLSAKEAKSLRDATRPESPEYFEADTAFLNAFAEDMKVCQLKPDIGLVLSLIEVDPTGAFRNALEEILLRSYGGNEEMQRVLPFIRNTEWRAEIIRRLSKIPMK